MFKNPDKTKCSFEGWATKNDLECEDGSTIVAGAFKVNDGDIVPVVWNHQHNEVTNVLGHALLENRKDGVYAYVFLNDTPAGKHAKETAKNGDISSLSIFATDIEQIGGRITHGNIREVSMVLAGCNPGAKITSALAHGIPLDEADVEAIVYTGEGVILEHSATSTKEEGSTTEDPKKEEPSVEETLSTLNAEQQKAVAAVTAELLKELKEAGNTKKEEGSTTEDPKKEENIQNNKGGKKMHNAFETGSNGYSAVAITQETKDAIMHAARSMNSFKGAIEKAVKDGTLTHAAPTTGMETPGDSSKDQDYGIRDLSMFHEDGYHSVTDMPILISRKMDWVTLFMSRVKKIPFKRIKSLFADVTEDEARAKGYVKGNKKIDEVISTLKRTTDPQTVYKKQKLDRDDILDLDFDIVPFLKSEMELMLAEEEARACLIGDGRLSSSQDKIQELHVRSVMNDVPLFNTVVKVTVATDANEATVIEAIIDSLVLAMGEYQGTGEPIFWTTQNLISRMLLLKNKLGERIYKTKQELATALLVEQCMPVDPMKDQKITIDSKEYPLLGIVLNPVDYTIGGSTQREKLVTEGFDIDFNQQKYLIEDRMSGALVKPYSAITLVLDKGTATASASARSRSASAE